MLKVLNSILISINAFFITLIGVKILDFAFNLFQFISKSNKEKNIIESSNLSKISLKDILLLTPLEFEIFCESYLSFAGYNNIEHVVADEFTGDGGKDIICSKNNEKYYVECKRYSNKSDAPFLVDISIVRKLLGAMIGDNINKGIIITTGNITDDAKEFCNNLQSSFSIEFITGYDLLEMFKEETIDDSAPAEA